MELGSQSHSPHYHFLHYAETDPLMIRSNQSHRKSRDRRANGNKGRWVVTQLGGYEVAHRSTAHKTHKNNRAEYRVSLKICKDKILIKMF